MKLLAVGLTPLALLAAQLEARDYWHGDPDCGPPTVRTERFTRERFAEADLSGCAIVFNSAFRRWPWPALCTIAIHEAGHLHGRGHDRSRVMRASYAGAIGRCEHVSPWLALPRENVESDWPG
jgi:hypothetical protein